MVFSPFSLEMIFGIISAGTSGDTQLELLRFLGLRSMKDLVDLVKIRSDLLKHFSPDHSALHLDGPVFSFTNGLWVPKSLPLKSSFKDTLTTMFNAAVSDLHTYNRGVEVIEEVNSWVTRKTNGIIKGILQPMSITNETQLLFINTVCFKGEWENPFPTCLTALHDFTLSDGSSVRNIPFMVSDETQYIKSFDLFGFKTLSLAYKKGNGDDKHYQFYLDIFLPNPGFDLPTMLQSMAANNFDLIMSRLVQDKVRVGEFRIPKFKILSRLDDTLDVLKERGVSKAFEKGALKDILQHDAAGNKLLVSNIFHKSFIEVNERETVAASVSTSVEVKCYTPSVDFVADHPFVFLVRELNSKTILFMGQVLNPTEGYDDEQVS
ncbi:serpin-Z4 [Medicago truncatula]|nr:serpin-Z4 [Medicago truncatula]